MYLWVQLEMMGRKRNVFDGLMIYEYYFLQYAT